ncbi:sensor histidine kinase [Brachybacterium sp. DNPG3]
MSTPGEATAATADDGAAFAGGRGDGRGQGPRRLSMRTTLVALLIATVAVVCLAVAVVTHASVRTQLHAELDDQLDRAADRAVSREQFLDALGGPSDQPVQGDGTTAGDGGLPSDPSAGEQPPDSGEYELTAVVEDGVVTSASWRDQHGEQQILGAEDRAVLQSALDEGEGSATVQLSIGSYRVLTREIDSSEANGGTGSGSTESGSAGIDADQDVVMTGLPLATVAQTLLRLDLTLLIAGIAAVLVTGLAGSFIVRRTLRPLEEVARLASDVASTPLDHGSVNLAERVSARDSVPGTEVGEVGRALNHLLDNVESAIDTRHRSEERMRRFIADASHELRTPLTAIRGYSEILRLTEPLSAQGLQSVSRLDAQSQRMTSLVEDLLLLTRLDDGAPRAEEDIDLGETVLESVMDARATAREHRWDVQVPDEPVIVRGDPRQLAQVVVNLLSNARKHTPTGTHVTVRLTKAEHGAVLTVRDDGPGIDPELLPDVFSRFTRADRARSGKEGTTGLGLSIVRAIALAHGGDVVVESVPGRTVFTLSLPLAEG